MYGKLLEFLRVSSLDPEFLIQCPDQECTGRVSSDQFSESLVDLPPRAVPRARDARAIESENSRALPESGSGSESESESESESPSTEYQYGTVLVLYSDPASF